MDGYPWPNIAGAVRTIVRQRPRVRGATGFFGRCLALGLVLSLMLSAVMLLNGGQRAVVSAATAGPRDAGAGTDGSDVGTVTWTDPGNVIADDADHATAAVGDGATTHYLQATNYGFSIGSDATIIGIRVSVGRYASGSDVKDYAVTLLKGGSVTGDNKAATETGWPTGGVGGATYGGAADLWGTAWGYSDVNASGFGVAISATNDGGSSRDLYVDYVQITVTYAAATPDVTAAATLYNSAEDATVTQMTPQTEYAVKATVADADTLNDLATVTVTIFYDSDGDDSSSDIPSADTQACCILTCTVGSTPGWSQDPGSGTTWDIVEGSCTQPALGGSVGDFWFHFKPGKVAAEAGDWDIYVVATDDSAHTGSYYDGGDYDMLWYGEIDVSGAAPNWGVVLPGMDFDDPSARESVTVSYVANGNYDAAVSTTNWTGGGNTATLNTAGSPGANEFSMKASSSDNLTVADLVTTSAGDCVIDDTGVLTGESGDTNDGNILYVKLGTPFVDATYSGTISFYIRNR